METEGLKATFEAMIQRGKMARRGCLLKNFDRAPGWKVFRTVHLSELAAIKKLTTDFPVPEHYVESINFITAINEKMCSL